MRTRVWLLLSIFSVLSCALSPGVNAEEAEAKIDTDLMQNIEDTNDSLASNIALEQSKASISDAESLRDAFTLVEDHFVTHGNEADAVELSRKSKSLTVDVIRFVSNKDFENAAGAATELSRTCKTCHKYYKVD